MTSSELLQGPVYKTAALPPSYIGKNSVPTRGVPLEPRVRVRGAGSDVSQLPAMPGERRRFAGGRKALMRES